VIFNPYITCFNPYFCRKYSFCYLFSGTWWFLHYQILTDSCDRSNRK